VKRRPSHRTQTIAARVANGKVSQTGAVTRNHPTAAATSASEAMASDRPDSTGSGDDDRGRLSILPT
jgi:hypothetical protein